MEELVVGRQSPSTARGQEQIPGDNRGQCVNSGPYGGDQRQGRYKMTFSSATAEPWSRSQCRLGVDDSVTRCRQALGPLRFDLGDDPPPQPGRSRTSSAAHHPERGLEETGGPRKYHDRASARADVLRLLDVLRPRWDRRHGEPAGVYSRWASAGCAVSVMTSLIHRRLGLSRSSPLAHPEVVEELARTDGGMVETTTRTGVPGGVVSKDEEGDEVGVGFPESGRLLVGRLLVFPAAPRVWMDSCGRDDQHLAEGPVGLASSPIRPLSRVDRELRKPPPNEAASACFPVEGDEDPASKGNKS